MPPAIPKGISADHVRQAAALILAKAPHDYSPPTKYEVEVDGAWFAPKALIGLAAVRAFGHPLEDFSSGLEPHQAVGYLKRLGFRMRLIGDAVGEDWTRDEIDAAIDAYFDMLQRQTRHEAFVKAEQMRRLSAMTHGRTVKSAGYKCRNISAVLNENDLPWLQGFAPAPNCQRLLADAVQQYLEVHPDAVEPVVARLDTVSKEPVAVRPRVEIEVSPPAPPTSARPHSVRFRLPAKLDLAQRDEANKQLGDAGEQYVVAMERAELQRIGRPDLAALVRWVAFEDGDGAGYDVRSFDRNGTELWIEVKTTNGDVGTQFFITANEVAQSIANAAKFRLYRLFSFREDPHMYVLSGDLRRSLALDPIVYRARPIPGQPG